MSLTFDGQSNLYIADYGNNRIISFNLLTNQSQITIPYNTNSNRNSYVFTPISIKYDLTNNSLVIAQELGFNVVRWMLNSDTTTWTLIAGSASSELNGTSRTLFNKICSIDIDNDGGNQTYVNDCYNQRIQFYNGDMTKGRTIAGVIGAIGNNSYTFNHPTAITLDSAKNLYVADSNNFRIQKFKQLH
jgi:sugar lactone lactonase YvrE